MSTHYFNVVLALILFFVIADTRAGSEEKNYQVHSDFREVGIVFRPYDLDRELLKRILSSLPASADANQQAARARLLNWAENRINRPLDLFAEITSGVTLKRGNENSGAWPSFIQVTDADIFDDSRHYQTWVNYQAQIFLATPNAVHSVLSSLYTGRILKRFRAQKPDVLRNAGAELKLLVEKAISFDAVDQPTVILSLTEKGGPPPKLTQRGLTKAVSDLWQKIFDQSELTRSQNHARIFVLLSYLMFSGPDNRNKDVWDFLAMETPRFPRFECAQLVAGVFK